MNLIDLYHSFRDIIKSYLENDFDDKELRYQMIHKISFNEAIDIDDLLFQECYQSIYHMEEPYCAVSDAELQYYVDCFEGKLKFSREQRDSIINSQIY